VQKLLCDVQDVADWYLSKGCRLWHPFDIKMAYNGTPWLTVQLELGHDEIGDTANPDYSISSEIVIVFEKLGFPTPEPVALMPIHHQIAQKLHAISDEYSERAHDLIDLQLIAEREDIDYLFLKEACKRLFVARKIQSWPPIIAKGEDWSVLYEEQIEGLSVLETVDEAIVWVNEFVRNIDKSK